MLSIFAKNEKRIGHMHIFGMVLFLTIKWIYCFINNIAISLDSWVNFKYKMFLFVSVYNENSAT